MSGFKREVTLNMLLRGHVARCGGGGSTAMPRLLSETTSLVLAEALWRRSSQGWTFDVWWQGGGCGNRRGCRAAVTIRGQWMTQLEGGHDEMMADDNRGKRGVVGRTQIRIRHRMHSLHHVQHAETQGQLLASSHG